MIILKTKMISSVFKFSLKLLLLLIILISASCENDIKLINIVGSKELLPVESTKNVKTIYSDSGKVKAIVEAPLLNRYEGEKPYIEMPKGIILNFYNSEMHVTSKLTAKYAISYEKERRMEAKNNVVVINEKHEQLNTEHLIWDRQKAIIYTEKPVTINTGKEILYGKGLEADERFNKWKIKQPTGSFLLKDE